MSSDYFWHQLKKPIVALAPMDGVTDQPYRYIQKKYGKTPVVYTEFTSVEGVCHGADRLLKDFLYDESQRPVVAQVYGTTPDFFRQTATLLCELGFDGIDINMGCPAKNVAHSGAGAALINNPKLAQNIVRETKAGIRDWLDGKTSSDCKDISPSIAKKVKERHQKLPTDYQIKRELPVSVKTRVGFDKPVVEEWIPRLLEVEPVTIAIHGRTLKQHYSGLANWDELAKAAEIIHQTNTLVLGNGDTQDYQDALNRCQKYGVDGVLLGRATFGNPFALIKDNSEDLPNIYAVALEHTLLFEKIYGDDERYNFLPMRKHLGWYIKGIDNASEIRKQIFTTQSAKQAAGILLEHNLVSKDEVLEIYQDLANGLGV